MAISLLCCAAPPQTEDALREQVRLHPRSFVANHSLGEFFVQQHKLRLAIPLLEKARQIDPSNYTNNYDLALVYLQTGMTAKSRRLIADVLKQVDRAELHNLLGDVEEKDGHIQDAAAQYEIAARMDPSEKNLFDLGSDLILHRGFEPALKVFEFATQRYPQSAKLRVGLGVVYYSLGQYDQAVESLCEAVNMNPEDTKALDFLGKMYDVSPQYADEVTKRLAHFVEVYPSNAAANYYYALSLRKRTLSSESNAGESNAGKDAHDFLLRAVKLNPAFFEAHYELGLLYEDEGRHDKAIHEYEAVTKLQFDFAKAHYHLARLYRKNSQAALAEKEFRVVEALKAKR